MSKERREEWVRWGVTLLIALATAWGSMKVAVSRIEERLDGTEKLVRNMVENLSNRQDDDRGEFRRRLERLEARR